MPLALGAPGWIVRPAREQGALAVDEVCDALSATKMVARTARSKSPRSSLSNDSRQFVRALPLGGDLGQRGEIGHHGAPGRGSTDRPSGGSPTDHRTRRSGPRRPLVQQCGGGRSRNQDEGVVPQISRSRPRSTSPSRHFLAGQIDDRPLVLACRSDQRARMNQPRKSRDQIVRLSLDRRVSREHPIELDAPLTGRISRWKESPPRASASSVR